MSDLDSEKDNNELTMTIQTIRVNNKVYGLKRAVDHDQTNTKIIKIEKNDEDSESGEESSEESLTKNYPKVSKNQCGICLKYFSRSDSVVGHIGMVISLNNFF